MARRPGLTLTIKGLETQEDKEWFAKHCAEFWMEYISKTINELPISHKRKVEFAKEVVDEIHMNARKKGNE